MKHLAKEVFRNYYMGHSIKNRYERYRDLAHQYHAASTKLWEFIYNTPFLFNPCMFLARHTIELIIKGLIYRDCVNPSSIKIKVGEAKKSVNNMHDLYGLWKCYLLKKQPCMFPTKDELNRIGTKIKTVSAKDIDSTKYRYPETKNPALNLNLEPIKIKAEPDICPDISKKRTLLVTSQRGISILDSGVSSLKYGCDVFNLIETLFLLIK